MSSYYNEERQFGQRVREARHNPCIMSPLALLSLFLLGLVSFIGLALQLPTLLLGILLSPLLSRFSWVIEFLYPWSIGRSVHLTLVKMFSKTKRIKDDDKNRGFHSRTLETAIEVVKERVYIHPLPQWLDNLGYLVVCLPAQPDVVRVGSSDTPLGKISVTNTPSNRIVAFVVDCGDAEEVLKHIELISTWHYKGRPIELQSILSTHKHHDHTAGNRDLLKHPKVGKKLKIIVGGAVEKVPHCNFPVADGDKIPLPHNGNNDMNDVVEVEVVATPAHTRGSVTYVLRSKCSEQESDGLAYLFTGDTMFSAGGGVAFESDVDKNQDKESSKFTPHTYINASASEFAIERCFAELLARCVTERNKTINVAALDQVIFLPGHEYTSELLARQMKGGGEACRWKNFPPSVFFETMSQVYVSMHRRSLPHNSGRLLCVPSPLRRELIINTHFRSLRKRGELVLYAIQFWHRQFATTKVADALRFRDMSDFESDSVDMPCKTSATADQWIIGTEDISASVFTTVYAADFDSLLYDLETNRISGSTAARRLEKMKEKLATPVVGRRPIPATLPTDRMIYKGLVGLALLGSRPSALTVSDSRAMKLPPPIISSSDRIRISYSRLIQVMKWLYLIPNDAEGRRTVAIIRQLWKDAISYEKNGGRHDLSLKENGNYDSMDAETHSLQDEVELGSLKWVIYGIGSKTPSCFAKFCMPCVGKPPPRHPLWNTGMQQSSAELVRHDVYTCYLCRSSTGCPLALEDEGPTSGTERPVLKRFSSTQTSMDEESFIEVSSLLKEA